jgi:hypothetical protein
MILQPDCPYAAGLLQGQPAATPTRTMSADKGVSRSLCPTADELKYRFVRLTIDCIDLYLVESGSALNVQVRVCWVNLIISLNAL